MSEIDDAIATLRHIRDDAAHRLAALEHATSPLPGSFCVHCGERINGVNGNEECPVSRYMSRIAGRSTIGPKEGPGVRGSSHLWSGGHVERWFNYAGPRGAERWSEVEP